MAEVRLVPEVYTTGALVTVPAGGRIKDVILPPVILPALLINPVVSKLPPVILPVALTCPAVVTLPPAMLPLAVNDATEKDVKLVSARFRSNMVTVVPESYVPNANS